MSSGNSNTRLRGEFSHLAKAPSEGMGSATLYIALFVGSFAAIGGGMFVYNKMSSPVAVQVAASSSVSAISNPSAKIATPTPFADTKKVYHELDHACVKDIDKKMGVAPSMHNWATGTPSTKAVLPLNEVPGYLNCVMTTQTERLCNAPYRAQLADQISRYDGSRKNAMALMLNPMAAVFTQVSKQMESMGNRGGAASREAVQRGLELREAQMRIQIKYLIQYGYLSTSDFGMFDFSVPEMVRPLVAPVVTNNCG
jgi:hypothetical protein